MDDNDVLVAKREALTQQNICWRCVEESVFLSPSEQEVFQPNRVAGDWSLCDTCSKERHKETPKGESNPYKKVWTTQEEIEDQAREWAKNDALFCPSYETMAIRHSDKARFLLKRARQLGRGAQGRAVFREAMIHVRLAKSFSAQADYINRRLK